MNVGLVSDRSDDLLVYLLLDLLLGDCLPDRRQVQMAWTVGESCSGVDDNLSAAAKAFVSSELVVDLAVLWQCVPPPGTQLYSGEQSTARIVPTYLTNLSHWKTVSGTRQW